MHGISFVVALMNVGSRNFIVGLILGFNVLRVRSDAAHNLGGVTHVQTWSVTDGSDLRVPSSHSKDAAFKQFLFE